ncbi:hypothetical protein [Oryzihumus sp.]
MVTTRGVASLVPVLAAVLVAGCSASAARTGEAAGIVGTVREGGVTVVLGWSVGRGGEPVLTARFTPQQPGFHLYSATLPANGVDGVGRPTRLEVGGALAPVGAGVADARPESLRVSGEDRPLEVYPDGPVTVRQRVRVTRGRRALVWVTYASCSRSTCLPPVIRHRVDIALPGPS